MTREIFIKEGPSQNKDYEHLFCYENISGKEMFCDPKTLTGYVIMQSGRVLSNNGVISIRLLLDEIKHETKN